MTTDKHLKIDKLRPFIIDSRKGNAKINANTFKQIDTIFEIVSPNSPFLSLNKKNGFYSIDINIVLICGNHQNSIKMTAIEISKLLAKLNKRWDTVVWNHNKNKNKNKNKNENEENNHFVRITLLVQKKTSSKTLGQQFLKIFSKEIETSFKGNAINESRNMNKRNEKVQIKTQYEVAKGYLIMNVVNTSNNSKQNRKKGAKIVDLLQIELYQNVVCE